MRRKLASIENTVFSVPASYVHDKDMIPYRSALASIKFTTREGGDWSEMLVHSIKLPDGIEWDVHNGMRLTEDAYRSVVARLATLVEDSKDVINAYAYVNQLISRLRKIDTPYLIEDVDIVPTHNDAIDLRPLDRQHFVTPDSLVSRLEHWAGYQIAMRLRWSRKDAQYVVQK